MARAPHDGTKLEASQSTLLDLVVHILHLPNQRITDWLRPEIRISVSCPSDLLLLSTYISSQSAPSSASDGRVPRLELNASPQTMPNTLAGQVAFSFPPSWMFQFPPDSEPQSVPPASNLHSISAPFGINPTLYNAVLQPAVPITFALGYVTCVKIANSFNRKRGNKPWSISKTSAFYYFVILHNVGLALYSAITCAAMVRALNVSVPSPFGEAGLPGTLDSLCKLNGPRGLGDAVYYDSAIGSWVSKNRLVHLAANNLTPDPTDVGRIWNEGLAFWGWWFYLSKFYEVFDTIIILAKGKRSSTLQTYHHSGAMLCMWAGIRYQGPPIWMFALVNAGIHTIMVCLTLLSQLVISFIRPILILLSTHITHFRQSASGSLKLSSS